MLVSVSLDLSDGGRYIRYIIWIYQISSALPSSQSLSSPRPGHPSGHQLSLSCFHPRKPSDHIHTSASPRGSYRASDTACVRGRVNSLQGSRFWTGRREKAKADCVVRFHPSPLMDCSRHNISNQPAQRAAL